MSWIDAFLDDGPEYPAERRSVAEVQALLLKAGLGAKLPLGHSQDVSGMAALLMSDPKLFAMAAAALEGPHAPVRCEGTAEHMVIDDARIAMAGPALADAFVCGAKRVVLHDLDWPQLLWPVLVRTEQVYGISLAIDRPDARTIMVSTAKQGLKPLGPPQPIPLLPLARLQELAAKTFVPFSEASRQSGAGAGLQDND
ncbi:hypothetical protein BDE40_2885 [Litoreibacter halocynthiae]|uniref:Uncharacterized protein n=1 Tax=Litoreibacter halocynthiae TaxID=1242689 RepID=A0A4R7LFY0_9RHOB|nr:hypothetical protein [Litoreibacter halocynthiae]TDT74099.1 hypothetical protein BDE40_2885 [Litoreibacter halocynthiae]